MLISFPHLLGLIGVALLPFLHLPRLPEPLRPSAVTLRSATTDHASSQPGKRRKAKQKKQVKAKKTVQKARSEKSKAAIVRPKKPLSGAVYYLASGHGGPDPGAIGKFGKSLLPEDEYAYDVTIRLEQLLKQQGATVYMLVQDPNDGVRNDAILKLDRDEVAYGNRPIPLNQTARLNQTTTAVNKLHTRHKSAYQRFITIHVDSRSQGQKIDVFFYHHSNSQAGQRLAKHIHQRFKANYKRHQPDRPYSGNVSTRNSLYVVKNSHPPTVFIELGNIQNPLDQRRFLMASNRLALANWMMQGILDDYRSR
ncbi:N-acetylmuramoyl-L-alanine amidase family protein [Fibrella aquatica]|uniref:N-acetylmuramoyl-L-alanine amidase family protein n=1 Tax=Fibrella aquatica TaxID=3242487 RepID=UPI00351FE908